MNVNLEHVVQREKHSGGSGAPQGRQEGESITTPYLPPEGSPRQDEKMKNPPMVAFRTELCCEIFSPVNIPDRTPLLHYSVELYCELPPVNNPIVRTIVDPFTSVILMCLEASPVLMMLQCLIGLRATLLS